MTDRTSVTHGPQQTMADKNVRDASGAPDRRQGTRGKAYFIGGENCGAKAKTEGGRFYLHVGYS